MKKGLIEYQVTDGKITLRWSAHELTPSEVEGLRELLEETVSEMEKEAKILELFKDLK